VPFLGPYRATADLIASADDTMMEEVYVVGMVMPQEPDEQDSNDNNTETIFSDDDKVDVPMMSNEQASLVKSFETDNPEEGLRQFMAAGREAPAAMLPMRANMARVTEEEEAAATATPRAEELA
jgi:hypothetical protein